ncbi:MAG: YccF domain-containing protein [Myxococcaceae bacterium]
MRFLLNILWAIFGGGFITALEYCLAGVVLCITIVGIPFGMQCFKMAGLALFPFGKDFDDGGRVGLGGGLLNVVWFLCAGLWIFLTHLAAGLSLAVTVIGIPFAIQHLKLAMLALFPFGVRVRERP